ncbi:unnamed protein product [Cyprideis torosa]|uniref:Uncharacterized protein n=1 Tax=Cyprideis torosa TaxID=163714 RepID=A0A7R8W5G2_9CRUS|nr:unnamed protein product [Cyprideis torosa]CAG0885224.1 unnamed protein product [Cyprideis torosa]
MANIEWQRVAFGATVVGLLFLGVPMYVDVDEPSTHQVEEFKRFLALHNKNYVESSDEYAVRLRNYQATLARIKERNAKVSEKCKHSDCARFGVTEFADWSPEEFTNTYLTGIIKNGHMNSSISRTESGNSSHRILYAANVPDKFDWRDRGVVTKVKNQGLCGACWAFSVAEVVESMHAIKVGTVEVLSTQELIDCAKEGNMGCEGGNTCTATQWMVDKNVGLVKEKNYGLTLVDGACEYIPEKGGVHVAKNFKCTSYVDSEDSIVGLVASHGPVSVAVDGSTWQDYIGGIIQFHCEKNLNHAAVIVGYDKTAPVPYYIVRNSWGPSFGNSGYLKIAIGSNLCGIAELVVSLDTVD